MDGMNDINLQDNVIEEIILNLRTQDCQFIRSKLFQEQSIMKWQKFLDNILDKQVIYYIDIERVLQETNINHILKRLTEIDSYSFQFRINDGQHREWFTAMVISNEKNNTEVISAKIVIENQNLYNIENLVSRTELTKEVLVKGFGSVYSNVMWIDINNDAYRMVNTFGNLLDVEMTVLPVGSYTIDNKGYAINGVYEEDWETFYKYTSLQWLREHLKKEGDSFSFLIRHVYNGEYRWTEVNLVCTKKNESDFHALYWIEDIHDKVYDNTAMKDTLASVEVGQWRYEIKNKSERKFMASPSLKRILELKDTDESEDNLNTLKDQILPEDRKKVAETIFTLMENEETSFSFRLKNKKGLRYYRCGITCIAKNDIYTCYQGMDRILQTSCNQW